MVMKKLRLIGRNLNLRLDFFFFALILTSIKLILVRQIQLFDFFFWTGVHYKRLVVSNFVYVL